VRRIVVSCSRISTSSTRSVFFKEPNDEKVEKQRWSVSKTKKSIPGCPTATDDEFEVARTDVKGL
jgi:hypothetical protein